MFSVASHCHVSLSAKSILELENISAEKSVCVDEGESIASSTAASDKITRTVSSTDEDVFSTAADSLDRFRKAKQLFTELESKATVHIKRPLLVVESAGPSPSILPTQSDFLTEKCSKRRVRFSEAPVTIFPTFSSSEYDRTNDTVDPVAASAEYELEKRVERLDLYEITLFKETEDTSLGFTIIGMGVGADLGIERLGMFIKSLVRNGLAECDGRIDVGDQIVSVNGINLVGVTQAFASNVLRKTVGSMNFVLGREADRENSEVLALIRDSTEMDHVYGEEDVEENENHLAINDTTFSVVKDLEDEEEVGEEETVTMIPVEISTKVNPAEQPQRSVYQASRITMLEKELGHLREQIRSLESIKEQNVQLERRAEGYERRCEELQRVVNSLEKERVKEVQQMARPATPLVVLKNVQEAGVETEPRPNPPPKLTSYLPSMLSTMKTRYNLMKTISRVSRRVVKGGGGLWQNTNNGDTIPVSEDTYSFPLSLDDVDEPVAKVAHDEPMAPDGWSSLRDWRRRGHSAERKICVNALPRSRSNISPDPLKEPVGGLSSLVQSSHKFITGSDVKGSQRFEGLSRYLIDQKQPITVEEYYILNRPPVVEWTPDQVCRWLCTVGLGNYAQSFLDRNVTGDRLLQLDHGKLKTLGLKSSKQREHVKQLIKKLREDEKSRFNSTGTNTGCTVFSNESS